MATDRKTALLVIDVQNDFCEGGSLAVAGGDDVAVGIARLIHERGNDYRMIVATRDWHTDPGGHFSDDPDFVNSWPVHCVAGSFGAEFRSGLDRFGPFVERVDAVVSKGQHRAAYSGFEGNAGDQTLVDILRAKDVDALDVVGIATDYCVLATALDGVREGFGVRLLTDLTAGVAKESTEAALAKMVTAGVTLHNG